MPRRKLWCLCALASAIACGGRSDLYSESLNADVGAGTAIGGAKATGGLLATGGTVSTWVPNNTGGKAATGGVSPIGGAPATGGASHTGGHASTGGTLATGGSNPSGSGGCCAAVQMCNFGDLQISGPDACPVGGTCYKQHQPCSCAPDVWCVVGAGGSGGAGGMSTFGGFTSVGGAPATGGSTSAGGTFATGGSLNLGGTTGTIPDGGVTLPIKVISASYGLSCSDAGTAQGNVTALVAAQCDGLESTCDILADNSVFGDPFFGCAKDFEVIWACGTDPAQYGIHHDAVAGEDYVVSIACGPP